MMVLCKKDDLVKPLSSQMRASMKKDKGIEDFCFWLVAGWLENHLMVAIVGVDFRVPNPVGHCDLCNKCITG